LNLEDQTRTGERRKMIFANVANGVEIPQIMKAFRLSETEVWADLQFVSRKIREYRFRRLLPPLASDNVRDIRWNRQALLETLECLGPVYLSSELILPRIEVQQIDSPSMARDAAQRAGAGVTGD
jgi:hypothetical protein